MNTNESPGVRLGTVGALWDALRSVPACDHHLTLSRRAVDRTTALAYAAECLACQANLIEGYEFVRGLLLGRSEVAPPLGILTAPNHPPAPPRPPRPDTGLKG